MTTTTNDFMDTNSENRNIFPYIFDVVGSDDIHVHERDYDHYCHQLQEDFNHSFNFDLRLSHIEIEQEEEQTLFENFQINRDQMNLEDHMLSQRLSQLFTTHDNEREPSMDKELLNRKKFRSNSSSMDDDSMPYYLLAKNKLFDQMIQQSMDRTCSYDMEELRYLAFFIHQIAFYEKLYHLWSIYMRAGTGQLKDEDGRETTIHQQHLRYWSKHVTSLLPTTPMDMTAAEDEEEKKQTMCEQIVNQRMRKYTDKFEYYQKQLNDKENNVIGLTSTIKRSIETFVQHYGITSIRMKCDFALALFYNNYDDYIIQYKYQQEKPTEYQIQVAKRLYEVQFNLETAKKDLFIHRQRLFYNQPPISYDQLQIAFPSYIDSILDLHQRQQFYYNYEQLIQQTKIKLMAIRLTAIEVNIDDYQSKLNQEQNQMFQHHRNYMTDLLIRLIDQRSTLLSGKFKIIGDFHVNYYFRSPLGLLEEIKKRRMKSIQRIGFQSNLIADPTTIITHDLTKKQIQLLNRGPTYVAPCQLQVLSSFQAMDTTIVFEQYAPLQQQLTFLFQTYPSTLLQSTYVQKEIKDKFHTLFSTLLIPSPMRQRAVYEQKLIQFIQQSFKKNNLLLRRTADQNNVFYLGSKNSFEEKCHEYMKKMENHYKLVFTMTDNNQQDIRYEFARRNAAFNTELENLSRQNKFSKTIYNKLRVNLDKIKLSYLYFLPDISMDNGHILSVKPMFSTYHSLTWNLGNYLHQLLRPVIIPFMKRTTIINDSHFIEKLHQYCYNEHRLHPTTQFVSIKIDNMYTLFSHQYITDILGYVLTNDGSIDKIQGLSVMTIERLTELFLDNNLFYYQGNIYRHIKSVPNSMLLSETLLNICLYNWQRNVFNDSRLKTELFVRYKDQLFFTWNHSENELHLLLTKMMEKYRHISMDISMGRCVHYLNVYVENRLGQLYTRVYHPTPQHSKLLLPYVVGHAKQQYRHWFRSALIRTVQLCSHYQDFNQERIYMEMSCLVNGYSIDFIETELKNFYLYYNIDTHRFGMNETLYNKLRRRLFDFINVQHQNLEKDVRLEENEHLIRLHYLYDYGPYHLFNQNFFQIWSKYFQNHSELSSNKTKIIFNAKHLFSLNTLLAEQKPSCDLLK